MVTSYRIQRAFWFRRLNRSSGGRWSRNGSWSSSGVFSLFLLQGGSINRSLNRVATFLGPDILGINLQDLLILLLGKRQAALFSSLQGFDQELGFLLHRICILGDQRASDDDGDNDGPSKWGAGIFLHTILGLGKGFIF